MIKSKLRARFLDIGITDIWGWKKARGGGMFYVLLDDGQPHPWPLGQWYLPPKTLTTKRLQTLPKVP